MGFMFRGCSSLKKLDLSKFETNEVTNMRFMFYNCSFLTKLDLPNFDTNNVTTMVGMFYGCEKLEGLEFKDNFKTEKVTDMSCFMDVKT